MDIHCQEVKEKNNNKTEIGHQFKQLEAKEVEGWPQEGQDKGLAKKLFQTQQQRSRLKILDFLFGSFKEGVSGSVWLGGPALWGVA